MIDDQTPGVAGRHADPARDHAPAKSVRPLKALGLVGYALTLVAVVLLAVALAAAALGAGPWPWVVATAVAGLAGLGCLIGVRVELMRHPARDRPQHDPLIPEVTEEEAAEYERRHDRR